MDEYKLRRLPKKQGVSSVDDLYHVLFYHWVHDDAVFCDEQQPLYVPTGILMASYFGCRPVSMFDIRSRFADNDHACNSADLITATSRSDNDGDDPNPQGTENSMDWNDNPMTFIHSDAEFACSLDAGPFWDSDSVSGTDDGVDAGTNETGSLLWRHIIFIIAPDRVFGQPNILFAKVTITHTKGEDNRPRE